MGKYGQERFKTNRWPSYVVKISQESAGSVKFWPTVKGGRGTKVANFTGVIVFESMNIWDHIRPICTST
jgi:hypothetical protein